MLPRGALGARPRLVEVLALPSYRTSDALSLVRIVLEKTARACHTRVTFVLEFAGGAFIA